jgi:hypothetical protein
MRDGGLRGKARFTHPTENLQAAWPPLPTRALAGGEGAGGVRGMTARKALWAVEIRLFVFSPEGGTSLPLVRKPPDTGSNTTILYSCDTQASIRDTSQLNTCLI